MHISPRSIRRISVAHAFTWALFLLNGHLFASDWITLKGSNRLDHWITESLDHWFTKGAWVLEYDGVIHLPKREYTRWKNYENYLVLKDILVTDFEFDWRVSQNSGVYFHIPDLTQLPGRHHKEVRLYENSL